MKVIHLLLITTALGGCGTTIGTLRVPLQEEPPSPVAQGSSVVIQDLRPVAERKTHTGRTFSCQRWYGDETFVPGKVEYLRQRLAARLPPGATLELSVHRFDTIEFCEDTANRAGAAAATGANYGAGNPTVHVATGVPGGDRVEVHLEVSIGTAEPFDITRRFDYSDLSWKFTELPAANPQYRERLRKALDEIAEEIVQSMP